MEITTSRLLILILEVVCIVLAASLVYLFAKIYKTKRSLILLSLPIGFYFLMTSYGFLLAHHIETIFEVVGPLSSSTMWFRAVTQTSGFALIALSYIFATRSQNTSKLSYLVFLAGSCAMMLSAFGLIYFMNPTGLASIYSYLQLFTWANIALLSFIIIVIARKLLMQKIRNKQLAISTLVFVSLWIGQILFSVFRLANGGTIALIGSQIARAASFAILIVIYYYASKEASIICDQKKQS